MSANPIYELFEAICSELAVCSPQIISEDSIDVGLLEDIKEHYSETNSATAYKSALREIDAHFSERHSSVPYSVDLSTRQFTATDTDYLEFVAFAKGHRSVGGDDSKDFEIKTLARLRKRLTGDLHRVGAPRSKFKKKAEIVKYLVRLGFDRNCLESRDKDGGLDILWLPPLGAVPLRQVVSLQCKNSYFDEGEANKSCGRAERTLSRHSHVRASHMKFVIFNDYIDRDVFKGRAAGWVFMPLGLTDLAGVPNAGADDIL